MFQTTNRSYARPDLWGCLNLDSPVAMNWGIPYSHRHYWKDSANPNHWVLSYEPQFHVQHNNHWKCIYNIII